MNIALIRAAIGALLISLLLVACGEDETDAQGLAAKSAAGGAGSPLLAYVPDDTPYFVANQERLSKPAGVRLDRVTYRKPPLGAVTEKSV